jgi:organic radical activating enzyme
VPDFNSLEPVTDAIFQVAWESTLKCNFDCAYCGDGHDNSKSHPSLEDSLKTVDFIFDYVDAVMSTKTEKYKEANLNIQGGESIFHPNIIEILEYINKKKFDYDWTMRVALITNGATSTSRWRKIANYIDYATMSFHPSSKDKYHLTFRFNCLYLKNIGKNFQINVMMDPNHWNTCVSTIEWAKKMHMIVHKRQIDHHWLDTRFNYTTEQAEYITGKKSLTTTQKIKAVLTSGFDLSSSGRSCCGGKTMCANSCDNITYVKGNNFKGWHCSVDKFFLYIRQTTGEIFTNKDCKMNFDGSVGPIGNLKNTKPLLDRVKSGTETIVCKKSQCWCGLCAPKAATRELFNEINRKYANTEE